MNLSDYKDGKSMQFPTTGWIRNAALFLFGKGISLLGSFLINYAIIWHVTMKTQSSSVMTLFAFSAILPMFFISPVAGVWADRYNRKHLINIADASIAAVTLLISAALFCGFEYLWMLLICSVVRALGIGVRNPSENAILPLIIPKDNLSRISGINSSMISIIMLVAPTLGGAVLTIAPIQYLMLINVITAGISIVILLFFVRIPQKPTCEKKEGGFFYYVTDIKKGFRYIYNHTFITQLLIVAAIYYIMICPAEFLTPLQVTRNFGADVWRLAVVEVSFSVGLLLGGISISLWGGFRNKSYNMAAAIFFFGAETTLLGITDSFIIYMICMALIGLSIPFYITQLTVILQIRVEESYLGRVFSVLTMISSVMMPLGMVFWGPLGDIVSIDYLLISTGVGMSMLVFPIILSKEIREAGRPI